MRTSLLKHRVTFEKNDSTTNDYGEPTTNWVGITPDEWVQIIPLTGNERYQSEKLNAEVNHKIRMRFRAGIDTTLRIVYGTRVFNIDAVLNVHELNKELQIMATERLYA